MSLRSGAICTPFRLQDTFLIIPEAMPLLLLLRLMPHPPTPESLSVSHCVRPFRVFLRSRLKRRSSCGDTEGFCDLMWPLHHSIWLERCLQTASHRGPCMSAPEIMSRCDGTQRQLRELRRLPFMKMSDHLLLRLRRIEWSSPHVHKRCAVHQSQSGFNPKSRSSYN